MPKPEKAPQPVNRSDAIESWLQRCEAGKPGFIEMHQYTEETFRAISPDLLQRLYAMIERLIAYEHFTWQLPTGWLEWANQRAQLPTESGFKAASEVLLWAAEMGTMCGVYLAAMRQLETIFRDAAELTQKQSRRLRSSEEILALQIRYAEVILYERQPWSLLRLTPHWIGLFLPEVADQGFDIKGYDKCFSVGQILRAHASRIQDGKRRLNVNELKELYGLVLSMLKVEQSRLGTIYPNYNFTAGLLSTASGSYAYPLIEKDRSWMAHVKNADQREYLLAGGQLMKLIRLFHTDWYLSLLNEDARFHTEAVAIFDYVYAANEESAKMLVEEATTALALYPEKFGFKKTSDAVVSIAQWFLNTHVNDLDRESADAEVLYKSDKLNSLQEQVISLLISYHLSLYNERLLIGATGITALNYIEEGVTLPDAQKSLESIASACQQIHLLHQKQRKAQGTYQRSGHVNIEDGRDQDAMMHHLVPNQADIELTYQVRQNYVMAKVSLSDYEINRQSIPDADNALSIEELEAQKLIVQFAVDLSTSPAEFVFEVYDPEDVLPESQAIWAALLAAQLEGWLAELKTEIAENPITDEVVLLDKGTLAKKTGQIPTKPAPATEKRKASGNGANGTGSSNGNEADALPAFIEAGRRLMYPTSMMLAPALETEVTKSRGKGSRADELAILSDFVTEFNANPAKFHSEKVTKAVRSAKAVGPNGELIWRIKRGDYRIFAVSLNRSQGIIVEVDRKSDETYEDMSGLKDKAHKAVTALQVTAQN